ncbi:MAG: bactofilin family protein [Candidatus Dadabacteria bacterium]
MFNKEKHQSADKQLSIVTLINSGTVFNGDVQSENDLRIDGIIHGNVSCKARVIIGKGGIVEGNIEGKHAEITGKVIGNIVVQDAILLRNKSEVHGNINAVSLQADTGALFNGYCQMGAGANVVLMVEENVHAKAQ